MKLRSILRDRDALWTRLWVAELIARPGDEGLLTRRWLRRRGAPDRPEPRRPGVAEPPRGPGAP